MVMEQQVSDKYGYTGYLAAILMPDRVREVVGKVRDQLEIPIHMVPAHVTVKGTFAEPESLDEIHSIIERAAQETKPFTMELQESHVGGEEGRRVFSISVESSPELNSLHCKLFNAIEPITTNVYGRESAEGFHFHMTVYQEVNEMDHPKGQALAASLSLPESVEARSVHFLGRVGPRGKGGTWQIIEEYQFSGI